MNAKRFAILAVLVLGVLLAVSPLVRRAGRAHSAAPAAGAQPEGAVARPDQFAPAGGSSPFRALDVFIDAGDAPLAAYQFEFWADGGDVKLVGIEGGEHAAFSQPPHYDPRALTLPQPRAIVAAFNTGADKDLPKGKTRVARLMVHVTGAEPPKYHTTLQVAASPDARPIGGARLTISEGATP